MGDEWGWSTARGGGGKMEELWMTRRWPVEGREGELGTENGMEHGRDDVAAV